MTPKQALKKLTEEEVVSLAAKINSRKAVEANIKKHGSREKYYAYLREIGFKNGNKEWAKKKALGLAKDGK